MGLLSSSWEDWEEKLVEETYRNVVEVDWEGLRSAWRLYVSSVELWMDAASDPDAPLPAKVNTDQLIHAVIAAHNSWSEALGEVVDATHHH